MEQEDELKMVIKIKREQGTWKQGSWEIKKGTTLGEGGEY